jgi:hypothetical protein
MHLSPPLSRSSLSPPRWYSPESDHIALYDPLPNYGGPRRARTADTRIFSAVLYQLSYRTKTTPN